jgi:general secretion pathway protein G
MARGRESALSARQAGSGWIEFAVVAVLLSTFAAVLMNALLTYQALAEKTAVELTIMNMRTGLRYRIASLIVDGRSGEVAALGGANPVAFLERPPSGYLGEVDAAGSDAELPRGGWRFELPRRELVYRVNREGGFEPAGEGEKVIRLRVESSPGDGSRDALLGVSIRVANPYDWR